MKILLFGISNVGKTTIGKVIADKIGYAFHDLDDIIYDQFDTNKERFAKENPFPLKRSKVKGRVLRQLVAECEDNAIIAVSPIQYTRDFSPVLLRDDVFALELCDNKVNIHSRSQYPPEPDDEHDEKFLALKERQQLKDIQFDIKVLERIHRNIKHKYDVNNQSVGDAAQGIIDLLKQESIL